MQDKIKSKMSKEYVAELLKQLEELKKKKARKEKKLQKLKGCSIKDLKNEKIARASHISIQSEPDQIAVNETSLKKLNGRDQDADSFSNLDLEKSSNNSFNNHKEVLVNEKCHSLSFENHQCNKNSKLNSNVDIQPSKLIADEECIKNSNVAETTVDYLKRNNNMNETGWKDISKSSENTEFLKPVSNKWETYCEKFKDPKLSLLNDELSCIVEKSPVIIKSMQIESENHTSPLLNGKIIYRKTQSAVENLQTEEVAIHGKEITSDNAEKMKQTYISNDLIPTSVPDIAKNFTNSSESENKSSNDSVKSLPGNKDKNSDILEDSLNANMSIFMSADLFAIDDNDKKELLKDQNCNELSSKNNESLQPVETYSKIQQNNSDVFNFPKFSTPTEGNTQFEKGDDDDDDPDLIEKSQVLNNFEKINGSSNKAIKNNLPSTSKFESPLLNFVLEKRLSSVLDAHYESPKKTNSKTKISSVIASDDSEYNGKDIGGGNAYKKRKLFTEVTCNLSSEPKTEHQKYDMPDIDLDKKSNIALSKAFEGLNELDQEIKYEDFDNVSAFNSNSSPLSSLKNISSPPVTLVNNSCEDVPSQVSKTVIGLLNKVCDGASEGKLLIKKSAGQIEVHMEENMELKTDSEVLVIPETEGLGLYFSKDTEEFLETSILSESVRDVSVKENFLNLSSQSKLESPVVNNILAAVKSSRSFQTIREEDEVKLDVKITGNTSLDKTPVKDVIVSHGATEAFENSFGLDTSFLEDDTQDLGKFKQVPYMNDVNVSERVTVDESKTDDKSNLNFVCSLSGSVDEPVMDIEIVLFNGVKYAVLQQKTCICVWRQAKNKQWIKIFSHQVEEMLSLVKMCISMDDDNLVIIMLLSNEEEYCLQFLIFEKDAKVIKLMENTHWLEEKCSEDSILLCGLSSLMFAIAQNSDNPEVSIHAFISLKENPRLMTAVLGSTETPLCSLCKIDKLPNALMGISDSMLYVWHILETRLVTAVSLHPHDYIPIKECFWATVENGLIYFLTTCEDNNNHICQLLAANLATGFCQNAMTFSTLPSNNEVVERIIKAAYEEPFLVVAHTGGAFIWSVMEEFCCATLPSASNISSIAISRDFDNWGLIAVGSKNGLVDCYSLH